MANTLFPITKLFQLIENIKKTHQYYNFIKIPDNWINIKQKLPLSNIQETNTFLKNNNINLSFPINHDIQFVEKIKNLKQHFNFFRIPHQFIIYKQQPTPDFSLINPLSSC